MNPVILGNWLRLRHVMARANCGEVDRQWAEHCCDRWFEVVELERRLSPPARIDVESDPPLLLLGDAVVRADPRLLCRLYGEPV